MADIQTVRGPVDARLIGRTLMHEHIFVLDPDLNANFDLGWHEEKEIAAAKANLHRLKRLGVDTLVDCTVPGIGRNIDRIRRVAVHVELNIIVATGLYSFYDVPLRNWLKLVRCSAWTHSVTMKRFHLRGGSIRSLGYASLGMRLRWSCLMTRQASATGGLREAQPIRCLTGTTNTFRATSFLRSGIAALARKT